MNARSQTTAMLDWWAIAGVDRAGYPSREARGVVAIRRKGGAMIWHMDQAIPLLPLAWARAENVRQPRSTSDPPGADVAPRLPRRYRRDPRRGRGEEVRGAGRAHLGGRRVSRLVGLRSRPRGGGANRRPALARAANRIRHRLGLRRASRSPRWRQELEARRSLGQHPCGDIPQGALLGPLTRSGSVAPSRVARSRTFDRSGG